MIAVVLAGGRSRRMGRPKALVPLGGRPLLAWPLAAAKAAGLDAVVVAKADTELPGSLQVWLEPDEPSHPLTGLVEALGSADGPIVALACDMPFVTPELIARLAAAEGNVVVRGEAFPARLEPAALPILRDGLAREAPLRKVLGELGAATIDADPGELLGVNDPDALARATQRFGGLPPGRHLPGR